MRCQHIERLIIESTERPLTTGEKKVVADHQARCESCAGFQSNYQALRLDLANGPSPFLSPELAAKTRQLCLARMDGPIEITQDIWGNHSVPKLVWTALLIITALTAGLFIPSLSELSFNAPMPFSTVLMLTVILQNAAMLIFSPVLIRKFRSRKSNQSGFRAMPRPT